MRTVKTRTGKQISAPPRYWVQARTGEVFEVAGKYWTLPEARDNAKWLFGNGRYAEVIVQNIDSGRRVAEFH